MRRFFGVQGALRSARLVGLVGALTACTASAPGREQGPRAERREAASSALAASSGRAAHGPERGAAPQAVETKPEVRPESSSEAPEPEPKPEPNPAPKPAPKPEPKAEVPGAPSCIAPSLALPEDLPDEAKSCLMPLLEAKLDERFFEPPLAGASPCAQETLSADGELLALSTVERFSAREHRLLERRTDPDDADIRYVYRVTETFDREGRLTKVVARSQDFMDETDVPDCENVTTTRHRYDAKGQPVRSERRIDTCEGVDAGTITTRRRFVARGGWVAAALAIIDRESPEEGREVWLPSPSTPQAHALCDDSGECSCEVRVLGCDGAVLGQVEADGGSLSYRRWRWRCPADSRIVDRPQ